MGHEGEVTLIQNSVSKNFITRLCEWDISSMWLTQNAK